MQIERFAQHKERRGTSIISRVMRCKCKHSSHKYTLRVTTARRLGAVRACKFVTGTVDLNHTRREIITTEVPTNSRLMVARCTCYPSFWRKGAFNHSTVLTGEGREERENAGCSSRIRVVQGARCKTGQLPVCRLAAMFQSGCFLILHSSLSRSLPLTPRQH